MDPPPKPEYLTIMAEHEGQDRQDRRIEMAFRSLRSDKEHFEIQYGVSEIALHCETF
jgi:hypothetical protein